MTREFEASNSRVMKSWLMGPAVGLVTVVAVMAFLPAGTRALGDYSRTASYQGEILVRW